MGDVCNLASEKKNRFSKVAGGNHILNIEVDQQGCTVNHFENLSRSADAGYVRCPSTLEQRHFLVHPEQETKGKENGTRLALAEPHKLYCSTQIAAMESSKLPYVLACR